MIGPKSPLQKPIDLNLINFSDKKCYQQILDRKLTKKELCTIFQKIKMMLNHEKSAQILSNLNNLKKQLRSKYSINISNDIIDNFLVTTSNINSPRQELDFTYIDKQIKTSLEEINKKKYYLNNKNKKETFTRKILSAEKRKRKNIFNNITSQVMPQIRSIKNFDQIFIKDKLVIFKDYLQEQQITKLQNQLRKKVEGVDHLGYGRYAERIKHYTIFDHILQRVFSLVQENTKNIQIRTKFHNIYKKMKEEMVSIVTNQEDTTILMKKLKSKVLDNSFKSQSKQQLKKNYFQLDRQKQDLTAQIEETLQGAKKNLKQAFLKRGRPDYAYEMQLLLENRKTPNCLKKLRM